MSGAWRKTMAWGALALFGGILFLLFRLRVTPGDVLSGVSRCISCH